MSVVRPLIILLTSAIVQYEASRILAVFPTPSISHQVVFRPLILELVKRGHEVVMITTDPIYKKGDGPANLTEIDVHDLSYSTWKKEFMQTQVTKGSKEDLDNQMTLILNLMQIVFEKQLHTDEVQSMLKDKSRKFDLLILEAYFTPLLGFTHVYDSVPVILVSSLGAITDNLKLVGAPIHPILYPVCIQQKINDHTSWDKISEMYNHYHMENIFESNQQSSNRLLRRLFGSDIPPIEELNWKVDLLFLNVHPIWDMNRPVPPNVIYMGGLHQKPSKELPTDLKNYLDSSKHGVIYVSFGTNVEPALLPPEKIQALIDAFSKLPYDVLWKWNQDVLPGRTENIKISKWLPQSDLLKHPKIKLFITQGGLQSTDEAITAGVPLIGMPMLGDQWFNVELYVRHKIGLRVDMDTITMEKTVNAIQTIVNDRSYRDNMVRLRTLMRDQPQTPLDRATWWTEYVLRHGGAKHLRSPAANMPWTQYVELELVSYLLIGLISIVTVLGFGIFYLVNAFGRSHKVNIKLKST